MREIAAHDTGCQRAGARLTQTTLHRYTMGRLRSGAHAAARSYKLSLGFFRSLLRFQL